MTDALAAAAPALMAGAVGVLVGAAMGYYTAATDLARERARAWAAGRAADDTTPNPYERTSR